MHWLSQLNQMKQYFIQTFYLCAKFPGSEPLHKVGSRASCSTMLSSLSALIVVPLSSSGRRPGSQSRDVLRPCRHPGVAHWVVSQPVGSGTFQVPNNVIVFIQFYFQFSCLSLRRKINIYISARFWFMSVSRHPKFIFKCC